MTINDMIQALEDERAEHGGEAQCVIELATTSGIEIVPIDELATDTRQIRYERVNRRNQFTRTEKCTMFLC